jgi:hypothetical protein
VESLERRRNVLTTALAILDVDWSDSGQPPVVTALRRWLGSWRGLGHVAYAALGA